MLLRGASVIVRLGQGGSIAASMQLRMVSKGSQLGALKVSKRVRTHVGGP